MTDDMTKKSADARISLQAIFDNPQGGVEVAYKREVLDHHSQPKDWSDTTALFMLYGAQEFKRGYEATLPVGAALTDARAAEILVQMREHMLAWGASKDGHTVLDIEDDDDAGFPEFAGECLRFLAPYLAAAPDAWPEEPTQEMQQAGAEAIRFDTPIINKIWTANAVYRAMRTALKGKSK